MPVPNDAGEWRAIADAFERKWNMPHCLGAIDGKHMPIQQPPKSGMLYYNFKTFFSIMLLAIPDANYKFIFVDISQEGSAGDTNFQPLQHQAVH